MSLKDNQMLFFDKKQIAELPQIKRNLDTVGALISFKLSPICGEISHRYVT